MTSSLRSTPDRAASDELLLRVHSRRPGRAHAVRHPEALHALTPTPAPATVTHTSSPTRDLGTTVLRHLNSPQVLSKDGGKLMIGDRICPMMDAQTKKKLLIAHVVQEPQKIFGSFFGNSLARCVQKQFRFRMWI